MAPPIEMAVDRFRTRQRPVGDDRIERMQLRVEALDARKRVAARLCG